MITTSVLLQRGFQQSFGTMGRGHHFATGVRMIMAFADFVEVCMDVHHLHETSDKSAPFGMLVGWTIAFSVLCNDDCYRASLAMHTDAASLSDLVTLLHSMSLCA